MAKSTNKSKKKVETFTHEDASRKNIPTAEYQALVEDETKEAIAVAYRRRNADLDPQLVWRGKDVVAPSDLVVQAPPLYIQEKVHPKVLIDDLMRQSKDAPSEGADQFSLFGDFNGIPEEASKTEFYEHDANWTNRMILGDSLQVMASLSEREGLKGKVQCIYFDPPYGIKFNSNFQWSTTTRSVTDGKISHITREPEQVRAFRDTWRDGVHSYLTYLRDRLTAARELLTESGSLFVQIGDENMHLVRSLMDEVFGPEQCVRVITFAKSTGGTEDYSPAVADYLLWYARDKQRMKVRPLLAEKTVGGAGGTAFTSAVDLKGRRRPLTNTEKVDPSQVGEGERICGTGDLTSSHPPGDFSVAVDGSEFKPGARFWSTNETGMSRLRAAGRIVKTGRGISYLRYLDDFRVFPLTNVWTDTVGQNQYGPTGKSYVVQTALKAVQRCILMTSDPGDLVLDPTCGSGSTAVVAEQWGRRWITIDTSRVALALARARIMGARYSFYLLADSEAGSSADRDSGDPLSSHDGTRGDIRGGFVYERIPHVTLKSIAHNSELDVLFEEWQSELEPLRVKLNELLNESWQEWEIPTEARSDWAPDVKVLHSDWWAKRVARQEAMDASISSKADYEYLYDRPREDKKVVRVAGPFTVESISPHRAIGVDENDELIDPLETSDDVGVEQDFATTILENLKTAGVQQAHKDDKLEFASVTPWPGTRIGGEGRYREGDDETAPEKRAAIFVGPEFGTVSRYDLVEAAKEAGEAGFDVLVACAFNYEAHATEFDKLGKVQVLKARMNADLHMADDLKNTGKGNLFVVFGEPDMEVFDAEGGDATDGQVQVKINGVDVFHPNTGEVTSDGAGGIACWFVDTDYNGESFFVRHAYFLGANDPYKALKTTLKAEIDADAWASLNSDTSRPFDKPESGRIAVKVINHLGDEVMKVMRVD